MSGYICMYHVYVCTFLSSVCVLCVCVCGGGGLCVCGVGEEFLVIDYLVYFAVANRQVFTLS